MRCTVSGFSLLEMLLVVALFGVIAAFTTPAVRTAYIANNLRIAVGASSDALRRAQTFTLSERAHDTWGVRLTSTTITVFRGASYAARVTSSDETSEMPGGVSLSGTTDFVFSGLYGQPLSPGTTTLTTDTGLVATVAVNRQGAIESN